MCGIAGIVSVGAQGAESAEALRRMQDGLRHRGPDGSGNWQSPRGVASFAHTRLAIFDPSALGQQPMSVGRFTITYNGAIYNYRALRHSLEQAGVPFRTQADTEVILRLFERWGTDGLEQLRGMFALAIWDEASQTCVLARDRFGIKPLYYSAAAGRLLFASEVRALVASRLVSRELDPEGAYGYFRTGSVPEPLTLLRDVRCLGAGQWLAWERGRLSLHRFASVSLAADGPSPVDAVASASAALEESVDEHFAGDREVAVFLSGGIDSTALVALARRRGHDHLQTLSMSLPGTADDEGPAARRIAEAFATRHHECAVTAVSARDLVPSFLAAMDQPSIDGLNTFVMSRFAQACGVRVVLSGIGADELFGGYPTFRGVPRLASWHARLALANPLVSAGGQVLERVAPDVRSRRVGDMLQQPPGLVTAYATYRAMHTRAEARTLAAQYTGVAITTPAEPEDAAAGETPLDAVGRLELSRYVRNQLLRDGDVMSMSAGVELRTPYLNQSLVSALARIPAPIRCESGKRLLLQAVPEIPAWVAHDRKRCFQFPFEQWLGAEWQDVFGPPERASLIPAQTWYRKWCVFALEHWMRSIAGTSHA